MLISLLLALSFLNDSSLVLVPNRGQWDEGIVLAGQTGGLRTELRQGAIDFRLVGQDTSASVRMRFVGARNRAPKGHEPRESHVSYFYGPDPARWISRVPVFASGVYPSLYSGIDLVLYSREGVLEYDLLLEPSARVDDIRLRFEGDGSVHLREDGSLGIQTSSGLLVQHPPKSYWRDSDGQEQLVASRFVRLDERTVGFALEDRPLDRHVVIDPVVSLDVDSSGRSRQGQLDPVLSWSTFLGGSDADSSFGSYFQKDLGLLYIGGSTASSDYPTTPGAWDDSYNGTNGPHAGDFFVACLDPEREGIDQLLWATYIGSPFQDHVQDLVADREGVVYIAGVTSDYDRFPTTPGAWARVNARPGGGERRGGQYMDMALVKLRADGGSLLYSTLIGGEALDHPHFLALAPSDGSGYQDVVITGEAYRGDSTPPISFPTTAGSYQETIDDGAGIDCIVYRFRMEDEIPKAEQLIYSTFFGGSARDIASPIDWLPDGDIVFAGETNSIDLPVTNGALQPNLARSLDGFVARLRPDPSLPKDQQLVYASYLGGSGDDVLQNMVVANGLAWCTGFTNSPDFPTTKDAFQTDLNGIAMDGFVAGLALEDDLPPSARLLASTYCGGRGLEKFLGIRVAPDRSVTASGYTASPDYPTTFGAFDRQYGGGENDAIVTRFDEDLTELLYSSFLGGRDFDGTQALEMDQAGQPILVGTTSSPDFPITEGAFDRSFNGGSVSFAARFSIASWDVLEEDDDANVSLGCDRPPRVGGRVIIELTLPKRPNQTVVLRIVTESGIDVFLPTEVSAGQARVPLDIPDEDALYGQTLDLRFWSEEGVPLSPRLRLLLGG